MLRINLPVQPVDLSQMLFQQNSHIIDMELAERYGCSLVVGSFREINDERDRLGLAPVKEARPSEVGISDYADEYQEVTLSLHHRKAAFLSSFIHPYKEKYFTGRVQFDLLVKGTGVEEKVLVIRRTGLKPQKKPEAFPTRKESVVTDNYESGKQRSGSVIKRLVERSDDIFTMIGKAFSGAVVALVIIACVGSFINKDQPRLSEQDKVRITNGMADAIQLNKEMPDLRTQLENIANPSNNDANPEIQ